ncbi:hypothetical protein ATO10_09763 [Actibacterium atlanticum]|uniref:Uncharacterized protein n=1 Tax=Actibacterium atlanticum TaxID=1461693 RepID=A0A058ZLP8_9RHOB|nr:hypothetical protein ATO10_09763 [Actibacterium atlanticum]
MDRLTGTIPFSPTEADASDISSGSMRWSQSSRKTRAPPLSFGLPVHEPRQSENVVHALGTVHDAQLSDDLAHLFGERFALTLGSRDVGHRFRIEPDELHPAASDPAQGGREVVHDRRPRGDPVGHIVDVDGETPNGNNVDFSGLGELPMADARSGHDPLVRRAVVIV